MSKLTALMAFLEEKASEARDIQGLKKALKQYKRRMQKHPTRSESRFQKILLSLKGLGFITNQKVIVDYHHTKGYILDFYLEHLRLAFEIDGKYHETKKQKQYDEARTSFLNSRGIKVVRIENETTKDEQTCIDIINREVKQRRIVINIRERMAKSLPLRSKKITSEEINLAMQKFLANGGVIQKPH